jgi:hypothetical protein
MTDKSTFPNEDAAERVTNIAGWVCKTCRRFFGDAPGSERSARYCCEKDHACGTGGCSGRAVKPYVYCDPCKSKRELDRYLALQEVDWDGKTPLTMDDDDLYFFSEDDVMEYVAQFEGDPRDLRFVICVPARKPRFDIEDLFENDEYLPDGMTLDDTTKINATVNRWIEKHAPDLWTAGKTRPSAASMAPYLEKQKEEESR